MARLIKTKTKVAEGEILNKWFYNRMIRRNQNVLIATTGGTGSGKSYYDLAVANSWTWFYFKKSFNVSMYVCFSIGEVMKLLSSGKLRRGDIIILEEAGANFGSLDFQNRVSKLFNYVLQSFRSMNLCLIMNLPVLSMLNKSARLLIHAHLVTSGIDYQTKKSTCKAYFRQINQQSGKIYDKFLRVKINGRTTVVKKLEYSLPPPELIQAYEAKKLKFVTELNEGFARELDELDKVNLRKLSRTNLTEKQQETYDLILDGMTPLEISKSLGIDDRSVYNRLARIEKRGYDWKKTVKSLKKRDSDSRKPVEEAV